MKKIILVVIAVTVIGAVGIFTNTLLNALYFSPNDVTVEVPNTGASPPKRSEVQEGDYPTRFEVPSVGIDAAIQRVGLNGKGNVASPSNFTDVGWYSGGVLPGQRGSALIDGHVDNGLGLSGVFKRLDQIRVGDDVYVRTRSGKSLHFTVEEVRSYPYKDVPSERLFEREDAPRLNLITCEGRWVRGDKTYDHRLVIYTRLSNSSVLQ